MQQVDLNSMLQSTLFIEFSHLTLIVTALLILFNCKEAFFSPSYLKFEELLCPKPLLIFDPDPLILLNEIKGAVANLGKC